MEARGPSHSVRAPCPLSDGTKGQRRPADGSISPSGVEERRRAHPSAGPGIEEEEENSRRRWGGRGGGGREIMASAAGREVGEEAEIEVLAVGMGSAGGEEPPL